MQRKNSAVSIPPSKLIADFQDVEIEKPAKKKKKKRGRPAKKKSQATTAGKTQVVSAPRISKRDLDRAEELLNRGPDATSPVPDFNAAEFGGSDVDDINSGFNANHPDNLYSEILNLRAQNNQTEAMCWILQKRVKELGDVLVQIHSIVTRGRANGVDMGRR